MVLFINYLFILSIQWSIHLLNYHFLAHAIHSFYLNNSLLKYRPHTVTYWQDLSLSIPWGGRVRQLCTFILYT